MNARNSFFALRGECTEEPVWDGKMGGSRLLEERLIACANLLPGARSLYRWKGGIEESSEMIVLLKTGSATAPACMTRLAELHPYEVPEILQIHPEAVTGPYAEWIAEVTGG